jgi:hypothetical protein
MNKDTLIRRIVSCESPLFLSAIFPSYVISEDISNPSPIIYTGSVTPARYNSLYAREVDFVACPPHGGDLVLSREDCVSAVGGASFRSMWAEYKVLEFVNILRLISIIGAPKPSHKAPSVYPIYEVISKMSLTGAKVIPDIMFCSTPDQVFASLLTFCDKSLHFQGARPTDTSKSRNIKYGTEYTTLLSLTKAHSVSIMAALARISSMEEFPTSLQVYALLLSTLRVI